MWVEENVELALGLEHWEVIPAPDPSAQCWVRLIRIDGEIWGDERYETKEKAEQVIPVVFWVENPIGELVVFYYSDLVATRKVEEAIVESTFGEDLPFILPQAVWEPVSS